MRINGSALVPQGRLGSRVTVKHEDGSSTDLPTHKETVKMPNQNPEALASVGVSITVGQSTQYAREKIEVSAWCTLPCQPNDKDTSDHYEIAYRLCEQQVEKRTNEAIKKFFPSMGGN